MPRGNPPAFVRNTGVGVHELTWDAESLSNGVYFCHMLAGGYSNIKKVVRLR